MRQYSSTLRNKVIHHGVDCTIFKKHKNSDIRNSLRKNLNINENDIVMINVGALTKNKGILVIIETLHILVNKMGLNNYKLVLKGLEDMYDCELYINNYFNNLLTDKKINYDELTNLLNNNIIFINTTLDFNILNNLYNSCDFYIAPYIAEAFCLPVIESIASGLSVLVPTTGCTTEYIDKIYNCGENKDGQEFIHFINSHIIAEKDGGKWNDISALDIVDTIVRQDFKREKSIEKYKNIIEFIEKNYSWNRVSELLYNHFHSIVFQY
jgi:glycosyltransferase involved in cell wall biosynthesis